MFNHSVRRSVDDNLRNAAISGGSTDIQESINAYELRYERQQDQALWFAISGFYQDRDVVSFNFNSSENDSIGNVVTAGLDLELTYKTPLTSWVLSHGYTKLQDFALFDSATVTDISASAYGYGNDLGNWSNHISKLAFNHAVTSRWQLSGSLRYYWGFAGAEDLTDYGNDRLKNANNVYFLSVSDEGETSAFEENIYLSLGSEYSYSKKLSLRVDVHNLMGWFDKKYNKRNFLTNNADYRSEAASLSVGIIYEL